MVTIKKEDIVYSWNEVEEVETSLRELTDEELVSHRDDLMRRLNNVLNSLGKYVTEEDINKLLN